MKNFKVRCTKTFLTQKILNFKCHDIHHFQWFFFISHWSLQAFTLIFLLITCLWYLYDSLPIFLAKSIRDSYKLHNLIIITITRILVSVRCGLFKFSKTNHLTMFLPNCNIVVMFVFMLFYGSKNNVKIITKKKLHLYVQH
jgi:hypothetical protein